MRFYQIGFYGMYTDEYTKIIATNSPKEAFELYKASVELDLPDFTFLKKCNDSGNYEYTLSTPINSCSYLLIEDIGEFPVSDVIKVTTG